MAQEYIRRFLIVTLLLVPLLIFSKPGITFLGIVDFSARPYLEFAIASIIFYFSFVFFRHAKHEIIAKQYGMMTLVSLAVGAGYLFSAASTFIPYLKADFYLEISTLVWILLFGHFLEAKSKSAAGDALQEVAKLLPKTAHLLEDGKTLEVNIINLKKNDIVLVKPGEKVPADGKIIKGSANLNEAHISGESKPIKKTVGDMAIAGAICHGGSLEVQLERVGKHSTIGQIQKLVKDAQQTKPTSQRLADKAAKYLTFIAVAVSFITIFTWSFVLGESLLFALTLAITVLVIACPHALGLAIPTVSTIATSLAVENGVFLKDLGKLEVVKDVDYVVFDKTGTLTQGKFGVTDVVYTGEKVTKNRLNDKQKQVVQIAASMEKHSSHVIGASIVEYANNKDIEFEKVKNFKNIKGKGISAVVNKRRYFFGNKTMMQEKKLFQKKAQKVYKQLSKSGKTLAFLADKDRIVGIIALSDAIKEDSAPAIEKLHNLGVKVAMLTGDSQEVAKAVKDDLKIDKYFAQVLPDKKYQYIKDLQQQGYTVMMVGDGVNDAPALTQANVGVAIGAGTDVAVEAGDIVLTRNNPLDISSLILLSKKVHKKMVENLIWALGYNIVAIPAAAGIFIPFGFRLTPEFGALLMSLSSVIVIINAITLRKSKLQL